MSGRIRVDMPSRLARFQVIPYLHHFLAQHPQLEIELGSTDRRVDLIREGYDCVVRVGGMGDSSLVARKLGMLEIINCASPQYLKSHGQPRSIEDLADHYLVHYVSTFGTKPDGFEYVEGEAVKTVPVKARLTVNNAEAYVAACLAGFGIIQSPRMSIESHLRRKEVVEVLSRFRAEPMPVYMVYPNQRNLPRRTRVFMDWLQSLLAPRLGK